MTTTIKAVVTAMKTFTITTSGDSNSSNGSGNSIYSSK